MGIPLLELRDVTYALNGKNILEHVSWTVRQGEHWAILGANGAGKTSLLKIVCGDLWPNGGGEVYRNGQDLLDLGVLRRSIGWVASTLLRDIPRREAVLDTVVSGKYAQLGLWRSSGEKPEAGDVAAAGRCLAELGCGQLAMRTFGTLSQGEQQQVLICRALMAAPYLLILDEPCAGMDPGARETFLSALLALGKQMRLPALIYVTHHPEEILPIFTRTLILKRGKVMREGETGEILTPDTMEQLYGASLSLIKRDGRYWPVPK
jgi:iron complex transport system ATP-binding protein